MQIAHAVPQIACNITMLGLGLGFAKRMQSLVNYSLGREVEPQEYKKLIWPVKIAPK